MQTKTSHIAQVRIKHLSNQKHIQEALQLTDVDYYLSEFESGIAFLENIYPPQSEFKNYYYSHAYSRVFWIWWHSEFKKWESELIEYLIQVQINLSPKVWAEEINHMPHDGNLECSFLDNYIKNLG